MRPPLPVIDPIVNALTEESQDITTSGHAIAITSLEKHSNTRVQHDMELWERIKEYDRKATEEASVTTVLTRKQKQNLKTQFLDGKQPDVEIMNNTTIQPVRVTPAQYREVQISNNREYFSRQKFNRYLNPYPYYLLILLGPQQFNLLFS